MSFYLHEDTLHTPRLALQPLYVSDADALARLIAEPSIGRFWFGGRTPDRADALALLQRSERLRKSNGTGLWGLLSGSGEALAGIAWLWPANDSDVHEFGFALTSRHRGQGYALEAGAAIVAHAHERLRWRRLQASTEVGTGPAARVLNRLGFREAGIVSRPLGLRRIFHRDLRASAAR